MQPENPDVLYMCILDMCSVYKFSPVVKYLTSSTRVQAVQRNFRNKPLSGLSGSFQRQGFLIRSTLHITSERITNPWFGKMVNQLGEFITFTLTYRQRWFFSIIDLYSSLSYWCYSFFGIYTFISNTEIWLV